MKRVAFVAAFAVVVTVISVFAYSHPRSAGHASAIAPSVPHCAVLEAQQMASPGVVVAGSYACLSANERALAAPGITSDQSLADMAAQPPVYTSYRLVGHTVQGYYFEMSPGPGCFRFRMDAQGLVNRVSYGPSACPSPLP